MDNKKLAPFLQRAFHCHIQGIKPLRKVLLAKTDRGMWIIKGYKTREKAEWVTNLSLALHNNGLHQTVQYVQAASGSFVVQNDSRYYTVMKMIDGREANHYSRLDVKRSLTTLARFHLAARGFPHYVPISSYQPPLLDKWEGRLREFEEITRTLTNYGPKNRFEQIILHMAEDVIREARQTLERAYKFQLIGEMNQAVLEGTLAHRDVASHNFLITPSGSCFLIDLDTVACDMQLADLVQFFGRIMFMHGYNLYTFLEGIEAYNKVKPLGDNQIWMIHQLLRYPDNFLREVTGVYGKRPGFHARSVQQLLQMEARLHAERRRFLDAERQVLQSSPWGAYHFVG